MSKIVRIRTQLPPEYSLKKYRTLPTLNIEHWSNLVSTRYHLRRRLDVALEAESIEALECIQSEIINLLRTPLPAQELKPSPEFDQRLSETISHGGAISELTMFEMLSKASDPRYGDAIQAFDAYRRNEDLTPIQLGLLHQPVFQSGNPPDMALRPMRVAVEVDIWGSDELLVADFIAWLTKFRNDIGAEQRNAGWGAHQVEMTLARLKSIAQTGAIQYVDLALWADAFEQRINASVLAEAVIGRLDKDRYIYERTKIWADWLLLERTHQVLQAQAQANSAK